MIIFDEKGYHKEKEQWYRVYITAYGRYFPRRPREFLSIFRYMRWGVDVHVEFEGDLCPYHVYKKDFNSFTFGGLVRRASQVGDDLWMEVHHSSAEEWWQ